PGFSAEVVSLDAGAEERLERSAGMSVEDLSGFPGSVEARAFDLDGDGATELCVEAQTTATCSVGPVFCLMIVLGAAPDRPLLLEVAAHAIRPGPVGSLGWHELVTAHDRGEGPVETRYEMTPDGRYAPISGQ
ncbi:MAG: hypothetical protein ACPGID_11135, partial [Rubricella sp.]